ncbi:MAG TPA: hypothetical protein VK524_30320 [Polyangiaceae bacterium]|nr:hypothetical protein [Polyangiaceae bacterium]
MKPVCVKFAWVGAAALILFACGSDKPAIPPVAPVVQPMQEEGLFGDDSAGDTSLEDSDKPAPASGSEGEGSSSSSSAGTADEKEKSPSKADDAGAAASDEKSDDAAKAKSRTKYKKQP